MFGKQYIVICLLSLLIVVTSQGFRSYGNRKHPTLDNHCYDEDHKLTFKVNETIYPTNIEYLCVKMYCREDYIVDASYCTRGTPTCGKPDYSKPYPECCSAC
ncbi:uncharacterized protein LOC142229313 [Haematobia irritans]|uniref:uncharacterized protein LOC142229313 n=1 Tax=Haematobia irritans TaxID=7368 RepID=UPI003F4FA080